MPDEEDALARRLRVAYLVLSLTYLAAVMWMVMVPEHKRAEMKLRLLRSCSQAMNRLARRTGAASMGHELATGQRSYWLTYHLSLGRDAMSRAYDRARGALS